MDSAARRGDRGSSHLWLQIYLRSSRPKTHLVFMAVTARKSVHISGPQSPQRSSRDRGEDRKIRRRKERRPAQSAASPRVREAYVPALPGHAGAASPSAPPPKIPLAKSRFTTRFSGINAGHFTLVTQRLLARAYPRACPACGAAMTVPVARRETAVR